MAMGTGLDQHLGPTRPDLMPLPLPYNQEPRKAGQTGRSTTSQTPSKHQRSNIPENPINQAERWIEG